MHQLFTYNILLTAFSDKTCISYILCIVNSINMQLSNLRRRCNWLPFIACSWGYEYLKSLKFQFCDNWELIWSDVLGKQLMQVNRLAWHSLYTVRVQISARFPESLYEPLLWDSEEVSASASLAETNIPPSKPTTEPPQVVYQTIEKFF